MSILGGYRGVSPKLKLIAETLHHKPSTHPNCVKVQSLVDHKVAFGAQVLPNPPTDIHGLGFMA